MNEFYKVYPYNKAEKAIDLKSAREEYDAKHRFFRRGMLSEPYIVDLRTMCEVDKNGMFVRELY